VGCGRNRRSELRHGRLGRSGPNWCGAHRLLRRRRNFPLAGGRSKLSFVFINIPGSVVDFCLVCGSGAANFRGLLPIHKN
jgi:hypothetical protein